MKDQQAGVLALAILAAGAYAYFASSSEPPATPEPAPVVTESELASAAAPPDAPKAPRTEGVPITKTPWNNAVITTTAEHEADRDEDPPPSEEFQRPDPEAPPLTEAAAAEPEMSEMEGGVADYDAPTEAQQRFRPFELAAIAQRPLSPEKWREIQGDNGDEILSVLRRAKALTDAEEPEAARELMEEWQRLTTLYRNEAYGRGKVLVRE